MAVSDLYIHTLAVRLETGYFTKQDLGIYRCHEVNMGLSFQKRRRKVTEKKVTTGYWIQKNFPKFENISIKFIAKGFGTYLSSTYPKSHRADISCEELLKSYLEKASAPMKIKMFSMILYYWTKLRFKKFV